MPLTILNDKNNSCSLHVADIQATHIDCNLGEFLLLFFSAENMFITFSVCFIVIFKTAFGDI